MTKLFGILIGAAIALSAYKLYRLEQQSAVLATALQELEVPARTQHPTVFNDATNEETEAVALLKIEITELRTRLQTMEQSYRDLKTERDNNANSIEQYSNTDVPVDFMRAASQSSADEEWFWSQKSTEHDLSLSFEQTEGFSVNSVVCRADWCRVEIEDNGDAANDLISGLELQLRINESLGRNTVIQSGETTGRKRVLFIQ